MWIPTWTSLSAGGAADDAAPGRSLAGALRWLEGAPPQWGPPLLGTEDSDGWRAAGSECQSDIGAHGKLREGVRIRGPARPNCPGVAAAVGSAAWVAFRRGCRAARPLPGRREGPGPPRRRWGCRQHCLPNPRRMIPLGLIPAAAACCHGPLVPGVDRHCMGYGVVWCGRTGSRAHEPCESPVAGAPPLPSGLPERNGGWVVRSEMTAVSNPSGTILPPATPARARLASRSRRWCDALRGADWPGGRMRGGQPGCPLDQALMRRATLSQPPPTQRQPGRADMRPALLGQAPARGGRECADGPAACAERLPQGHPAGRLGDPTTGRAMDVGWSQAWSREQALRALGRQGSGERTTGALGKRRGAAFPPTGPGPRVRAIGIARLWSRVACGGELPLGSESERPLRRTTPEHPEHSSKGHAVATSLARDTTCSHPGSALATAGVNPAGPCPPQARRGSFIRCARPPGCTGPVGPRSLAEGVAPRH
jgi:hypothetical protein